MNRMLLRPTAALFPLIGLAATLLNGTDLTMRLFGGYFLVQLFSLCAADCFRNAAAQEPGVRRVDRRFGGALTQLSVGGGILLLLCATHHFESNWPMAVAAILISFEQMFEERVFALARRMDGAILNLITNALLLTGLLLDGGKGLSGPLPEFFTLCAAALGVAIAAGASYAVESPHGFSLKPVNYALAPRACLQTLLYPAAGAGFCLVLSRTTSASFQTILQSNFSALLIGLILWRLARTVCRRSPDESLPLNLLMISLAALSIAVAAWMPGLRAWALPVELALICAAATFCAPSVRLWCGIALTAAALALTQANPFISPFNAIVASLCATVAILLNLKHAFLKRI